MPSVASTDRDRLTRLLAGLVPAEVFDHVWICGPPAMVEDARAVLAGLDVPAPNVHVELFYGAAPPPVHRRAAEALTGATTELTTVLDGVRTTSRVSREATVLDGAQRTRSDLPFACRGGVCGTCRAAVRDGTADMRRNYALEPSEVDAGFVLTCQSFPVGESLTVDYDA